MPWLLIIEVLRTDHRNIYYRLYFIIVDRVLCINIYLDSLEHFSIFLQCFDPIKHIFKNSGRIRTAILLKIYRRGIWRFWIWFGQSYILKQHNFYDFYQNVHFKRLKTNIYIYLYICAYGFRYFYTAERATVTTYLIVLNDNYIFKLLLIIEKTTKTFWKFYQIYAIMTHIQWKFPILYDYIYPNFTNKNMEMTENCVNSSSSYSSFRYYKENQKRIFAIIRSKTGLCIFRSERVFQYENYRQTDKKEIIIKKNNNTYHIVKPIIHIPGHVQNLL